MSAIILDGKAVAATVRDEVALRVAALAEKGVSVGLATVLVGDDPASHVYVRGKRKLAELVGIASFHHELPDTVSQDEIEHLVRQLNDDPTVDGILVQLPLPAGLDSDRITEIIDPGKDADGLHPYNLGRLVLDRPSLVPCTPRGIMKILEHYEIETAGKNAVVVGRSFLVGRPVGLLLGARGANATVTLAHSRTQDLAAVTREADILIAAVGVPHLIGPEYVKPGATVIDVGINRRDDRLVGDVDFDAVLDVAGAITPVPGGVGPMTIAMLMDNTVTAAESRVS